MQNHMIFPTHTPVDRQGGGDPIEEPMPLDGKRYRTEEGRLLKKLSPLVAAKNEADKVYSNGYFENHYPDADKKLKRMLHSRVMNAWANALNEHEREEEEKDERPRGHGGLGNGGVTIHISVGG